MPFTFVKLKNKTTVEIRSVDFYTRPQRGASTSGSRPGTSPLKAQIKLTIPREKWLTCIESFTLDPVYHVLYVLYFYRIFVIRVCILYFHTLG